jgi:hypothetical protein
MTYFTDPNISDYQKQILGGTILGGSSIVKTKNSKNCFLSMRSNNYNWLAYKILELECLFKKDINLIVKDKNTYRGHSLSLPIFNFFHNNYYVNGKKKVDLKTLDGLNDAAWMIWFCDAGKVEKNKVILKTTLFGEKCSKIIHKYFKSFDINCDLKHKNNSYYIEFVDAEKYLKVFAHRMPNFMLEKLNKFGL